MGAARVHAGGPRRIRDRAGRPERRGQEHAAERVVPAIAATLAVYAGLAIATALYLQQHYMAPLLTEGGWLLALSALLIAATVWLVRRRAA